MTTMFASPAAAGGSLDLDAALGHLLIIQPLSVEEGMQTVHGETDAIRARVIDVTDPGLSVEDALIFPRVLVGALRPRIGQWVLGRLARGVAKPGKSAPWLLEDAVGSPEDVKAAQEALKSITKPAAPAKAGKASRPVAAAPPRDDEIPF